jgi:aryl-alcohol dehydrogenase-like predicted oxidoreductase
MVRRRAPAAPQHRQGCEYVELRCERLPRGIPHFTPEAMVVNQAVVEAVELLAAAKGATAAQVALAWLLARGPSIVPIFGRKPRRGRGEPFR